MLGKGFGYFVICNVEDLLQHNGSVPPTCPRVISHTRVCLLLPTQLGLLVVIVESYCR